CDDRFQDILNVSDRLSCYILQEVLEAFILQWNLFFHINSSLSCSPVQRRDLDFELV
ncbi:Hypothetical protein FKW44_021339, partial [Caligus rogercresseyi]